MDIDLAKTFLAVVQSGSFVEAARRVHVTQSTVSMRIRSLEDQLGRSLFERSKAGASLTAAGTQFHRHALALIRVWEQARLESSLPAGYQAALVVGSQYSLWDEFLLQWVSWMRANMSDIAVRTEMGFSGMLMQRMVDGTLDLGVMYTPESRPGFQVEMLFDDELVLVSSEPGPPIRKPGKNYVYVDWGPEFQADHSLNFPDLSTPGLYMALGSLGLKYVLENGCSGYFPRRIVKPFLDAGTLKLMASAPTFSYPVYAVYQGAEDPSTLGTALDGLRRIAARTEFR